MQKLKNTPSFGWIAYNREVNLPLTCGRLFDEELIPKLRGYFPEHSAAYDQLTIEGMDARPYGPYLGSSFLGFVRQQEGDSFVVLAATKLAFEAAEAGDPSGELRAEMDGGGLAGVCWTDSDAVECYRLDLHLDESTQIQTVGCYESFAAAESAMIPILTAMNPDELKGARETGEFFINERTLDGTDHCEPGSIFGVNTVLLANS